MGKTSGTGADGHRMYDCLIVGGGPAGLSAALLLGRCRRRVLLCDHGRPRNQASHAVHGFLTRDGIAPHELRCLAQEQLRKYLTVELRTCEVLDARRENGEFLVELPGSERVRCGKLLLATGVVDRLPEIAGLEDFYGRSLFHCPYCDGWEFRDQPLAVYGNGKSGAGLALTVSSWSRDVVLFTDGPSTLTERELARLARRGVSVCCQPIVRLEGREGQLERVVLDGAEPLPRRAMFVHDAQAPQSDLAERLGCRVDRKKGMLDPVTLQSLHVPGLYLAGDATRDLQMVSVAAADGTRAAYAIHKALLEEEIVAAVNRRWRP